MRPLLSLLLLAASSALAGLPPEEQARQHLGDISNLLAPLPSKELILSRPTLVAQAAGQLYESGLPPVWMVRIQDGRGDNGYLMWENSESGALLEFALDGYYSPVPGSGGLTKGVPALQQFPVPGLNFQAVASGCVPTAGASLVGYWTGCGFPEWSGPPQATREQNLKQYAQRLRKKLRMAEMPDTSGYTDDGMTLSGAFPQELAAAMEQDARAHGLFIKTEFGPFSFQKLKTETEAARPVLLSCMVRLPQKPHLSWGHEIIGVGWLEVRSAPFAGVKDNFYPTDSHETVRWIRTEAFQSLIAASPQKRNPDETGAGADRRPDKKQTP